MIRPCLLATLLVLAACVETVADTPPTTTPHRAGDSGATPPPATPPSPAARAPVQCGTVTCGPDEACVLQCTCCGARLREDQEPSGRYECQPLAPACLDGSAPPEECQRRIERPCA